MSFYRSLQNPTASDQRKELLLKNQNFIWHIKICNRAMAFISFSAILNDNLGKDPYWFKTEGEIQQYISIKDYSIKVSLGETDHRSRSLLIKTTAAKHWDLAQKVNKRVATFVTYSKFSANRRWRIPCPFILTSEDSREGTPKIK